MPTLQNSGVSRTPLFLSSHQQILTISPSKYIWDWQLFTQSQLAPRPGPVNTHLDSCSGHPAGLPAAALAHLFSAQHPSAALRTSGRSHPSQNQSRRFSHAPPKPFLTLSAPCTHSSPTGTSGRSTLAASGPLHLAFARTSHALRAPPYLA